MIKIRPLQHKFGKLKKFYYLYTSGLNRKEIERLLEKDTVDAFAYYKQKTSLQGKPAGRLSVGKVLVIFKEIFLSFVMKLTPARRLFYGISLVVFIAGIATVDVGYLFTAFMIINLLLALELADKLTTRDELEIAREIQVSLQPDDIPELPDLSIAAFSKPARLVGGDFYNMIKREEDQVHVILGDVSGKGIPAALYAAHIQSMFESVGENVSSPAGILCQLNALITRRLREGDFITAAVASFAAGENAFAIARAGHNWPLHYSSQTGNVTTLKPKGASIGVADDGEFSSMLEEMRVSFGSGDVVLVYSDGITEATNARSQMFDVDHLASALKENAHRSAQEIVDTVMDRLDAFVKSEELVDDATMVAIKAV